MKTHRLTRCALLNSAGAAAIGLSAATRAGCAAPAAAATEPTEGAGADLASKYPAAIRMAVAMALAWTLLTSAVASAAEPVFTAAAPIAAPARPQTLTGDWFGQGPACVMPASTSVWSGVSSIRA
jgi:hypothetical protein